MLTATGPRVPGTGPSPCSVMIVGEGPGEDEAAEGVPFVGRSGQLQDRYLMMNGMHRRRVYITNLIKNHIPGNGNPTKDDIAAHTQELVDEIIRVRPQFIIAVGAFSARWFLGAVDLESVHGLPHKSVRGDIPKSITIIPVFHPAYGLRDPDANTLVWWGYTQAAKIIRGEIPADPVVDLHPDASYVDAGPDELREYLQRVDDADIRIMAADVEGPLEFHLRDRYWGFSVSSIPGTGLVFRRSTPGFRECVDVLNSWLDQTDPLFVLHNGIGLDIEALRLIGVKLPRRLYDTMIAAFFLRVEPQALKPLARRHCGMAMRTYEEVIGEAALQRQIGYLVEIATQDWGKPEPRIVYEHDGTTRLYRPQPLHTRVTKILEDYYCKPDVDLGGRWSQVDRDLRGVAEEKYGPWPVATLDDIPLESAVGYSGRDPDATLRVYYRLEPLIRAASLEDRLQVDLDILPCFEEMQATGFIANRPHFESLSTQMWDRMMQIGQKISIRYNDGQPFNPMSAPQVAKLAASRNLRGVKKTKTGKVSTSKKSMEHLRTVDEAMDMVFQWREHEKIRDSFAEPIVGRIPAGHERWPIRCNIKLTRTASDRIAASDPNLTGIPVASELGLMVRNGFESPDGCLLGTADLSQIEMRVMAHLSGDPLLCKLFLEGRDIHAETASLIFHIPLHEVRKMEHRNPTKRAGFGVITGIQGEGLLDQLRMMGCEGWHVEKFPDGQSDCVSEWCPEGIIHSWFSIYPAVKGFLRKCGDRCEQTGMVREMGGFPRYLPGVWSGDEYIRAEARRQSHSHVISGSAQWMLRLAMRWLKPQLEELRESTGMYLRWTMQIHDELIFTFDEMLHDVIKSLVLEALTKHTVPLRVPVEANWASAKQWGKLEK